MVTTMSRQVGAHEMTFEAGKLAKLADGASSSPTGRPRCSPPASAPSPARGSTSSAHDRCRGADVRSREDPGLVLPA